jgi:hypothetical protein
VQRRRAAAGGVPLGHVADEPVRLRTDRDLVPLAAPHEHETGLVRVVAEALHRLIRGRGGLGCGPRSLRVSRRVEGELEEAPLTLVGDRGEDADDVAVSERRALDHPPKRARPPDEGPVDAAAVDDEPARSLPLEGAVARAGDQELRVGLEGDVVGLGEAADGDALAGQLHAREDDPVGAGDDDLRSTPALYR